VLWGPPGCGKTTLALLVARYADADFRAISAVLSGLPDVRKALAEAEVNFAQGRRTVLFVDEVHRFNKTQQDAFLPHIERGVIIFIGATTENPSFELNSALLSRCRVHVLEPVSTDDIIAALKRALADSERGLGALQLQVDDASLDSIAQAADGDVRRALTLLEIAAELAEDKRIDEIMLVQVLADRTRRFDKQGEQFYDQISALHKSVRSSDPDAAVYWLCRMLDGGVDPLYLARRMTRMAVEDIGLAEPRAWRWMRGTPTSVWAVPKANSVWLSWRSGWPSRRKATPLTWPTTRPAPPCAKAARWKCRCTCATHRPS
jgi:putative ATPase